MCIRDRVRLAGHPDEVRVGLPDPAELDRLARPRRVDLHVATGVDAHVTRRPDDVPGLGVGARDLDTGVALGARDGRQIDAELPVHVRGEARAVEPCRGLAAGPVRDADVASRDLEYRVTGYGLRHVARREGWCRGASHRTRGRGPDPVSYTHLRAHETDSY